MRFMDLNSSQWKNCQKTEFSDLILQLRAGGTSREKAMNCLFEKLFYMVYTMKNKFDKLEESDILAAYSKALLNLLQEILKDNFRGESSLSTWFYTIFYRRCVDATKKTSSNNNEGEEENPNTDYTNNSSSLNEHSGFQEVAIPEGKDLSDESDTPEARLFQLEHTAENTNSFNNIMFAVEAAMDNLTEKCRHLLRAYFEGYSMDEMAEMNALKNAHTARQSVYRCRNRLRKALLNELEAAISQLGEKCQQLLGDHLSGLSAEKVALKNDITEIKAQRMINNCFNELKKVLSNE